MNSITENFSLEKFQNLTGHNPKFLGERYEIPHGEMTVIRQMRILFILLTALHSIRHSIKVIIYS